MVMMMKMTKQTYLEQVPTSIQGIPCLAGITTYLVVPPWKGPASTAPSDLDYYGYTEVEYDVLDRKGYYAEWLERKMTGKDKDRVEEDIHEFYRKKGEDYES